MPASYDEPDFSPTSRCAALVPLLAQHFDHRIVKPLATLLILLPLAAHATAPDFSREVRPILSQHGFKCHGPDKQKGRLRLEQRESAVKAAESDAIAIVPGKPEASELLRRVTSHDDDEAMPPREGGNVALTEKQIGTLRAWIAAGA